MSATRPAPVLNDVRRERPAEIAVVREHVERSLKELMECGDWEIGRAQVEFEPGIAGAEGRHAQAETRHEELSARRTHRRAVPDREKALTLQEVERIASVRIPSHAEREAPEVRNLRQDLETEGTAMRLAMAHECETGREPMDVSAKNLGSDITSLDYSSGEVQLMEVKGIGAGLGSVLLTPKVAHYVHSESAVSGSGQ